MRTPSPNWSCRSDRLEQLQPDGAFLRSPCLPQPSKSRRVSPRIPIRDSVDEALVPLGVRTLGDRKGLPVRLGQKGRRPHVWYPNLDRPQPLLAQPLAMRSDLV